MPAPDAGKQNAVRDWVQLIEDNHHSLQQDFPQ